MYKNIQLISLGEFKSNIYNNLGEILMPKVKVNDTELSLLDACVVKDEMFGKLENFELFLSTGLMERNNNRFICLDLETIQEEIETLRLDIKSLESQIDNALWHIWQTTPNDGWSNWQPLGGVVTSDITIRPNADGRLEVFVKGVDNGLWHIWQVAPNDGWSRWAPLGGTLIGRPAVRPNIDGRLEAFVRGDDNVLWHIWQIHNIHSTA